MGLCRSHRALEPVRAELTSNGSSGSRPALEPIRAELISNGSCRDGRSTRDCPPPRRSRPQGLHYGCGAVYCGILILHVFSMAVQPTSALGADYFYVTLRPGGAVLLGWSRSLIASLCFISLLALTSPLLSRSWFFTHYSSRAVSRQRMASPPLRHRGRCGVVSSHRSTTSTTGSKGVFHRLACYPGVPSPPCSTSVFPVPPLSRSLPRREHRRRVQSHPRTRLPFFCGYIFLGSSTYARARLLPGRSDVSSRPQSFARISSRSQVPGSGGTATSRSLSRAPGERGFPGLRRGV